MGPFTWGPGGQKITAAQAKNLRDVATALAARKQTPQNLGQGFSAIGDALLYNSNMGRAGEAEAAGQAEVAQALAMARASGDPAAFYDVLGNDWATPAQQLVAGSMMDRQYAMDDRNALWAREDSRDALEWDRGAPMRDLDMQLTQAQLEAAEAKPAQPLINAGGGSIYDPNSGEWISDPNGAAAGADFDDVSGIRKEVQGLPSYKNLAQASPIYSSMFETAGRNSKASDLNLVYGLGKIMDPTSVVREGEMVMVKNAASLPDWLVGTINSLNGGAALTPETRQAILTEAYGRLKGYEDAFNQDIDMYRGIAERYGINEADVLPSFPEAQEYGGTPQVTSDADYDALPSGTVFIGPDGKQRRKP